MHSFDSLGADSSVTDIIDEFFGQAVRLAAAEFLFPMALPLRIERIHELMQFIWCQWCATGFTGTFGILIIEIVGYVHLAIHPIIRRFVGDGNIMRVGFAQAR